MNTSPRAALYFAIASAGILAGLVVGWSSDSLLRLGALFAAMVATAAAVVSACAATGERDRDPIVSDAPRSLLPRSAPGCGHPPAREPESIRFTCRGGRA